MKVFISQPMRDKTDEQIKEERAKAVNRIKETYNEDVEIINSFFENAPHNAKPLWFLGKSLELLADADIAYFCKEKIGRNTEDVRLSIHVQKNMELK